MTVVHFALVLRLQVKQVFMHFAATEFLQHDHFVFTVFRGTSEQLLLLLILSHIDNTGPVLFVLCLETFQKFVEAGITFGHTLNALIERLTGLIFFCLDELLELFDFLDALGLGRVQFCLLLVFLPEEQHARFLILIRV